MEKVKKITQCCYCKNRDEMAYYYNTEEHEMTIIAHGCSNCKNYNDIEKNNLWIQIKYQKEMEDLKK